MTRPRAVLTLALPPLSVYVRHGAKGAFWLNVVLTALFYLPGVLHAFWVLRRPRRPGVEQPPRPASRSRRHPAAPNR